MKWKKTLCAGLTLALLACPALAAEEEDAGFDAGYAVGYSEGYDAGYSEGYEAAYQAILDGSSVQSVPAAASTGLDVEVVLPEEEDQVVKVVAPDAGRVVVNPYRMKLSVDGAITDAAVIGEEMTILNESAFPILVTASAEANAAAGSGVELVSRPSLLESSEKALFLYLEFRNAAGTGDAPWSGRYSGAENQLAVTGASADVLELPAGEAGLFRVFGSAYMDEDAVWTARDSVSLKVCFTFTPLPEETAPEPALETTPEPDSEAVPETTSETDSEVVPETGSEAVPETTSEPDSEAVPEADPGIDSETVPEVDSEADSEAVPEADSETDLEPVTVTTSETEAEEVPPPPAP